MNIAVVLGSCRKNGTGMEHLKKIEQMIRNKFAADFEYLYLGDYNIQTCRGCMACYELGEDRCPHRDGYLNAMKILNRADAAIFYSPTYTLTISGLIKTFFDRSSYVLHRPHFKGRYALLLSTTMFYGEKKALSPLNTIVSAMGFTIAGRIGIISEKYEKQPGYQKHIDRNIQKAAFHFARLACINKPIRPTILDLMVFYFQKRIFASPEGGAKNDRQIWHEKGWTDPGTRFYCNAKIPAIKRIVSDILVRFLVKSRLLQF